VSIIMMIPGMSGGGAAAEARRWLAGRLRRMSIRAVLAVPRARCDDAVQANRPPSKDRSKMAAAGNFSYVHSSHTNVCL